MIPTLKQRIRNLTGYAQEHPLGYRLMVYVSTFGFFFILLSTALQLALDYRRELQGVEHQTELIRSSYLASLAKSLWDLDRAQIAVQLKGIQSLPDVLHVNLHDNRGDAQLPAGNEPVPGHRIQTQRFELIHRNQSNPPRTLGELHVTFDLQALDHRVWQNGLTTLLSQTLLVMLIVVVILVIFQRQITRHLEAMANFSRRIGAGELKQPLELDRYQPQRPDELDQLVSALNEMRQSIQQDIYRREEEQQALRYNRDQLQEMVERRTQSLQRAKEAAEEASNAKSQFLSTMSHEIRTPMNGMLGMIQLLERSELSAQQRRQLKVLHEATDNLLDTFNHVLQYGRLVEGAYLSEKHHFSLRGLVESVATLLSPGATEKGLQLVQQVEPAVADPCFGASGSLRQILTNLLANAIKFTEAGSVALRVGVIDASPTQQRLRFEIVDTGIGIAPELQQHIFDRFTQADESITRRYGGTGLGLAICKELAKALAGKLGLNSAPGKGSSFWLELPLRIDEPATAADATGPLPATPHLRILLVEDIKVNQEVVVSLLAYHGHQIEVAADGEQAIECCRNHRYDLILMDMHLPGCSGLEVSHQIQADPHSLNAATSIAALTASVRSDDIRRYLEAGLAGVVAKPVKEDELLLLISELSTGGDTPPADTPTPESATHPTAPDVPAAGPALLDQAVLNTHRRILGEKKLQQLLQEFKVMQAELWPTLHKSLADQDSYGLSETAHKLAGACDTLGFRHASQLLRQIEMTAPAGSDQLAATVSDLEQVMVATLAAVEESRPTL